MVNLFFILITEWVEVCYVCQTRVSAVNYGITILVRSFYYRQVRGARVSAFWANLFSLFSGIAVCFSDYVQTAAW